MTVTTSPNGVITTPVSSMALNAHRICTSVLFSLVLIQLFIESIFSPCISRNGMGSYEVTLYITLKFDKHFYRTPSCTLVEPSCTQLFILPIFLIRCKGNLIGIMLKHRTNRPPPLGTSCLSSFITSPSFKNMNVNNEQVAINAKSVYLLLIGVPSSGSSEIENGKCDKMATIFMLSFLALLLEDIFQMSVNF